MKNNYLIYSLEDDKDISHIIELALKKQGYLIQCFNDPSSFFESFNKEHPNMVLLDLMLPEMSGEEVLKKIRASNKNDDVQVIIISAKNLIINKIDGLDLGADDYISKPFDVLELISRVNAHARRALNRPIFTCKWVSIDTSKGIATAHDKEIKLTNTEYEMLLYLMKNSDRIISRSELFNFIWGTEALYESRVLDVHMKEIRKKIEDRNQDLIETVYGVGYRIKSN